MTTTRRQVTVAAAAVLAAVALVPASDPAAAHARTAGFDFDTGNAALEIVVPAILPRVVSAISPSDATIFLRIATVTTNGVVRCDRPLPPDGGGGLVATRAAAGY